MADVRTGDRMAELWPYPLRLLLGAAFVFHGLPKFGAGHAGFAAMLQQMSIPAPGATAWIVALVELLGGIALLAGALVPVATALLVIEMLVAMFQVHLPHGFEAVNIVGRDAAGPRLGMPGVELNLLYIAGLLALFLGGPGRLSLDHAARRWILHRNSWRERRPVHG